MPGGGANGGRSGTGRTRAAIAMGSFYRRTLAGPSKKVCLSLPASAGIDPLCSAGSARERPHCGSAPSRTDLDHGWAEPPRNSPGSPAYYVPADPAQCKPDKRARRSREMTLPCSGMLFPWAVGQLDLQSEVANEVRLAAGPTAELSKAPARHE